MNLILIRRKKLYSEIDGNKDPCTRYTKQTVNNNNISLVVNV